ncbi:MAG TPA: DUF6544 family protein [Polyangiales bacterium]|nr:DUF6544 family protein [Polyangiales bacterium]
MSPIRWLVAVLLLIHGAIHLLGFVKAFGFAALPQLSAAISRPVGLLWLAAGVLSISAAFASPNVFWKLGASAIVLSQIVIVSAWSDAKFGTLANLVLLLPVVYAFASRGPLGLRTEYQRDAARELAKSLAVAVVTEADLAGLPPPVQRYLRVSGAVGQPKVFNVRAHWLGRIRNSASEPWMTFSAEQLNTYGQIASRLFIMDASMKRLPVDIYHQFIDESATFRVRLLSAFPLVDAKGPEMNRSETVTVFNDMCVLAPGALIDPALRWQLIDSHTVRASFTRLSQVIEAELHFNDAGELVDFISDDRSRASSDGKSFTRERWSTPLSDYRSFGSHRLSAYGVARTGSPAGAFNYGEFRLQAIDYNVTLPNREAITRRPRARTATPTRLPPLATHASPR